MSATQQLMIRQWEEQSLAEASIIEVYYRMPDGSVGYEMIPADTRHEAEEILREDKPGAQIIG